MQGKNIFLFAKSEKKKYNLKHLQDSESKIFSMFFKKKHKKIDFLKVPEKFSDLVDSLHRHQHRKNGNALARFFKYLAVFVLLIIVLAGIISGIIFFKFKNAYDLAISGKNSLQNSITSAQQNNFSGMNADSLAAENDFTKLAAELQNFRNNFLVKNSPIGQNELNDIDNLVKSAGLVSKALAQSSAVGEKLNDILGGKLGANFSEFTTEQKQSLLKFIYQSGPELNGVKADLDLALLDINQVQANGMLSPFKPKILDARNKLEQTSIFLSQAVLASELLPELAGYPKQSTFLVLFENNDELRPTGGFLGTYGILQTKNGDLIRFDSHDIYHMDEPIEAGRLLSIVPPDPIKKYLNKNWYMRDANWSPDWPTSAAQINWFYNKENALLPPKNQINNFAGQFDGVIAITPDFVTSLLDLTGPITVDGEQFNAGNFTNLLQYKVEQDLAAQNVTSWQRKEIIGKILAAMKIKLFDLDYSQWPALAEKLNSAVAQKNILFFTSNDYLEGVIKNLGAGGEIKNTAGDYLMLVDSNMASLKTDAVMQRKIAYQVRQQADGLYADLKITYTNSGKADWRTSDYKDYARIYLPQESVVKSATGFSVLDKTYNESGKTVVAGLLYVRLGKSAELNISYKLPASISSQFSQGNYQLYLQKQPGNRINSVQVDVTAPNAIKSYNPLLGVKISGNNIVWNSDLTTDKELSLNF
jgi:hypothetical protein